MENYPTKSNHTPFKGKMADDKVSNNDLNSKFTTLENSPDKIIRAESFEILKDRYKEVYS